jgi:hypothetical protein
MSKPRNGSKSTPEAQPMPPVQLVEPQAEPILPAEPLQNGGDETAPNGSAEVAGVNTPDIKDAELDKDEAEFRSMRRDLPGVKGASSAGIAAISVNKLPAPKNEFFRTDPNFSIVVAMVDAEVGMEKQYFAVTEEMETALNALTVTARGGIRLVPVKLGSGDREQNEYDRTREIGLIEGMSGWVRIFHNENTRVYDWFPAPEGRYADPIFPTLKHSKIFRMAFRDRGRLIDSTEHPFYKKQAGRDFEQTKTKKKRPVRDDAE